MDSAPYEIYKCLFKHRLLLKLPEPCSVYQQDHIFELCFESGETYLKMAMDMAYLREKNIPTVFWFTGPNKIVNSAEGDLMENEFFQAVDTLLDLFQ